MHPAWAQALRDEAAWAGVPFFFKQWGEWSPVYPGLRRVSAHRYYPPMETFRPDGSRYDPLEPDTLDEEDM